MNLQQIIDEVAAQSGIDPATAERAAGTIFAVIAAELEPSMVQALFAKLSDAAELAQAHPLQAQGAGILGSIAGAAFDQRGSALVAGFSELKSLGLTQAQIGNIGTGLRKYAEENGGAEIAKKIAGAIPGLAGYLSRARARA